MISKRRCVHALPVISLSVVQPIVAEFRLASASQIHYADHNTLVVIRERKEADMRALNNKKKNLKPRTRHHGSRDHTVMVPSPSGPLQSGFDYCFGSKFPANCVPTKPVPGGTPLAFTVEIVRNGYTALCGGARKPIRP
ncbi:hypothetical protein Tco_0179835 [Tanacetum coccineum]